MKRHLLTFVALVCSLMVSAYDFKKDFIYYTITSETDLTVEVTSGVEYNGVVNIPSTVVFGGQTYNVTSIGVEAFAECYSLTSVTLPAGLTSIGEAAFCACSSLTSVTIPEGVTSIGQYTFMLCSSLTSITIPNSVTSIGEAAFYYCSSLTSVTLPAGLTSIGGGAFQDCSSLTSVTLPAGLTSIGESAFWGCNLTTVIVGNATPAALVNYSVFSNRSNTVLYVPAGSKAAYESAYGWGGFKEIVENKNITFADSMVKAICVANWDTNGDGELSPPEAAAVTTIGQTFKGNAEITSFDEFQYFTSVETLIDDAFRKCSSLTSITLPAGLTSIGDFALWDCSSLTSITLPAGLTSIGLEAFVGCNLTTVIVGNATPAALVGHGAFGSRFNTVLYVPAGSKAAYESAYGWGGFKEIVEFENITFADSKVKKICVANWDTNGDGKLSYIEAAAVTSIGRTFKGYAEITSFDELQYFTALEKVSGDAFTDCASLTSIIFPSNVKTIEQNAFYSSGIISLEIPASVSSIADAAFNGIINMESITVAEGNPVFDSRNGCNAIIETATNTLVAGCKNTVIPNSVTAIGGSAFRGNTNLTSITIPGSVTSIAADAFKGCKNLTKVTVGSATPLQLVDVNTFPSRGNATLYVPAGSKAAYESASVWSEFKEIVEFENITFADSKVKAICVANWDTSGDGELSLSEAAAVTTIGQTFRDRGITSFVELQYFTSVKTLTDNAFRDCSSLTSVTIPEGVTSIREAAFYYCSSLTSVTIPMSVTSIGEFAFGYCFSLTSLTLPAGVTSIGENAFYYCSSLTSVTLPAGLTSIGRSAFYYCSSLTSVTLPAGLTSIGAWAFSGCSSLTSVAIPESVTSIGYAAFSGCSSLTSVTIPEGLTSIEDAAFWGCNKLTSVTVGNATPAALVSGDVFTNRSNAVLYVPAGSKAAYESASVWSEFKEIVEIENITFADSKVKEICVANWDTNGDGNLSLPEASAVTTIGHIFTGNAEITSFDELQYFTSVETLAEFAFSDCSSLTSLTLPAGVTSIGVEAFAGCSSLTSITLPEGLTSIGRSVFDGCSSLTSITIPNSVTSIREYAFYGCSSLTSVTLPAGVTSIGNYAFRDCSSLTSITLPAGLTSIGEDAFCGCYSLTSVTIPESVTSIGGGAFYYCSSLTSITLPVGVASIGEEAFAECSSLTSVTIPEGLTSIGDAAFYGCDKLTTVIVGNATPAALVSGDVFTNRSNAVLYVPAGSKAAYESASVWNEFKEIVEEIEVPENMFVLNNMTLRAGQSGLFPVALTNESEFTAFQCDIYLPEGITLQTNKGKYDITLDEERMDDQAITSLLQADGAIRMAVASFTSSLFSGNSGNLFYLNLLGGENISGDLTISIKNIHISEVDGTKYYLEDVTATITVPACIPADVNNDGMIAINDVVLTINAVLGIYADNFVFAAADMNGDNQIMINDVVQVINSVLGLNTTSVLTARHIVRETLDINETQNGFGMSLSNAAGYTAMQYDMTLPAGVSIDDIRVTAGSNHSVSFREVGDGQVRVAVVSLTNEAFASGSLLEVSVSAESATSISITNAYVATRRGVMVEVADAEAQLTRGGATGIQAVGVETAPADIFDLSGRIVKKAATSLEGLDKGVYLMNGKKVVVK